MLNDIHTRLKASRIRAGYKSARQFAMQNKLVENTYRSHENGDRGIKQPDAERYAELLNIDLYWLITGKENPRRGTILADTLPEKDKISETPHAKHPPANPSMAESADGSYLKNKYPETHGKIPVLGYASGTAETTAINWDYDAPIGWVEAPPKLAGVLKASAVIYRGDSMYPRYLDEDVIIMNRAVMPAKGRDCVFDTKDGGTHIKTFLRADKDFYYFKQYSPEKEIKIPRREVIGIYAVTDRVYL